jgi:outer membrane protein assembly factor BamE (lipoprotein component of BamABCDE complex)
MFGSRPCPSAVAALVISACGLTALAGCAAQCSENFYAMHKGMTKGEVQELLGAPSSTWDGDENTVRWQYGDSLSSLATSGLFHDADTARVWVVWFDSEGRVTDFSEPEWKQPR